MRTGKLRRAGLRATAVAGLATVALTMSAPVANAAETSCDRTVVHKILCSAIDPSTYEEVRRILCTISGQTCP
jgi:hypothetical protein